MPSRESDPPSSEPEPRLSDRLDSWKEIAAHMRRGVTTVQRWELEERLPVHRLPHARKGSVFAYKRELDFWRVDRAQAGSAHPILNGSPDLGRLGALESPVGWMPRRIVWVTTSLVGLALIAVIARSGFGRSQPRLIGERAVIPVVPRPLANDPAPEHSPSLSPDGTQVVYDWKVDGLTRMYIKPVDGGSPRTLAVGEGIRLAGSAYAKWSPRGDLIAFLGSEGANRFGLYVVPPAGGAPRHLTSMAGIGLCWHPDGSSIGFVDRDAAGEPFSVFSVALDTGQRRRLTVPPPSAFGDTYCSYSPDGRQLAVVRYATRSSSDLYIADAAKPAADRIRRLTVDSPGMEGLAWSPDGQSIVVGLAERTVENRDQRERDRNTDSDHGRRRWRRSFHRFLRLARAVSHVWRTNTGSSTSMSGDGIGRPTDPGRFTEFQARRCGRTFRRFHRTAGRFRLCPTALAKIKSGRPMPTAPIPRQVTFHADTAISPQWSPDGLRLAFSSRGGWELGSLRRSARTVPNPPG